MPYPICAVCNRESKKAKHDPQLVAECGFDLPSDADLQDANPRVKDLRVKNRLGTVLCSKGGKKNCFGDRQCYYHVSARPSNPCRGIGPRTPPSLPCRPILYEKGP